MREDRCYEEICRELPEALAAFLLSVPRELRTSCCEIRLRPGRPISLFDGEESRFLDENGAPCPWERGRLLTPVELREALVSLTGFSVHSYAGEMEEGYFTTPKGHRVGISLDCTQTGLTLFPSAVSIRVAREKKGAAEPVLRAWEGKRGLILAGPPSSGKTTVLRDLARLISSGHLTGKPKKTAVIDERLEITALYHGVSPYDLGPCTDIIAGKQKREAILQAVRSLSPEYILCDEIASPGEIEAIRYAFACGVRFVVTVHSGLEDVSKNEMLRLLMETGSFSHVALLQSHKTGKQIRTVIEDDDFLQASGGSAPFELYDGGRALGVGAAEENDQSFKRNDPLLERLSDDASGGGSGTGGDRDPAWKRV